MPLMRIRIPLEKDRSASLDRLGNRFHGGIDGIRPFALFVIRSFLAFALFPQAHSEASSVIGSAID